MFYENEVVTFHRVGHEGEWMAMSPEEQLTRKSKTFEPSPFKCCDHETINELFMIIEKIDGG